MTDQATQTPEAGTKKASLAHRLYTGEVSYDFVATRNRWYLISGIVLLISILAIGFRA